MILDISQESFRNIFGDGTFDLPIRWDGKNFEDSLSELFKEYIFRICNEQNADCSMKSYFQYTKNELNISTCHVNDNCPWHVIKQVCNDLVKAVGLYLNGFPEKAYNIFSKIMKLVIPTPIKIYPKTSWTNAFNENDPLNLFRVVSVSDNINHPRTRVFHTPYSLRTKVGTNRYSIAGFPSLYLGTNIELCMEEIHSNPYESFSLCSLFKIVRDFRENQTKIDVIELAIKPQDFLTHNEINYDNYRGRIINPNLLRDSDVRRAYLIWYPIIAASSFIRAYKNDPFAPEYIIPQLLMQWIRNWSKVHKNKLLGIRYFSCSSKKASELGFNYVFPTSGKKHEEDNRYCEVLVDSFRVSSPVFIHEFNTTESCEDYLTKLPHTDLKHIYE